MMKKSFLMIGALCMGAAFVSCVDDSESSEVKDLRKLQLGQEQAKLDQTYWNMYEAAINNVKTYQGDLNTAQQNLDGIKSGNLNHTAAKDAAIAYQNMVIARNQKDINDKKAEIEAQKKMEGMTYEQVQEAKIAAKNAEEKAKKDAADYWLELNNAGLNLAYNGNTPRTVDVNAEYSAKIAMLLGGGSVTNIKYQNNKLCENDWVKAMNAIYSSKIYYYDYDGVTYSSTSYVAVADLDDNGVQETYNATDMFNVLPQKLSDNNGFEYQTYNVYSYNKKNGTNFMNALSSMISDESSLDPIPASYYEHVALKKMLTNVETGEGLNDIVKNADKEAAYKAIIADYVTKANKIYALDAAKTTAAALSTAYASYSSGVASDNEKTIAGLEDAIKGYNKAIAGATEEINKIENEIVDDATAQKYYEALVADLNSQIAANNAVAEKYRALIVGSSSNNTQNTTPAETTAE